MSSASLIWPETGSCELRGVPSQAATQTQSFTIRSEQRVSIREYKEMKSIANCITWIIHNKYLIQGRHEITNAHFILNYQWFYASSAGLFQIDEKKLYKFCQRVSGYLVIFSPDNRLPSAVMFSCPECSLSCILDCTHTSCWSDNRSLTAGHSRHQTPGIRAMVTTFIVTWAVTTKTWGLMKIKGSQTRAKPLSQRLLLIIPSEWDYSESVSLIQQASGYHGP